MDNDTRRLLESLKEWLEWTASHEYLSADASEGIYNQIDTIREHLLWYDKP